MEREMKPRKREKAYEVLWVASSVFQPENVMYVTGTEWKILEETY